MVHPALLRTVSTPGTAAGGWRTGHWGWGPLKQATRLFRRLNRRTAIGYRPEQHYMRGGRTAGAKSIAAG